MPHLVQALLGLCGLTDPHLPSLLAQVSLSQEGLLPNPSLQDRCILTHLLWGMMHTVTDSTQVCACVL